MAPCRQDQFSRPLRRASGDDRMLVDVPASGRPASGEPRVWWHGRVARVRDRVAAGARPGECAGAPAANPGGSVGAAYGVCAPGRAVRLSDCGGARVGRRLGGVGAIRPACAHARAGGGGDRLLVPPDSRTGKAPISAHGGRSGCMEASRAPFWNPGLSFSPEVGSHQSQFRPKWANLIRTSFRPNAAKHGPASTKGLVMFQLRLWPHRCGCAFYSAHPVPHTERRVEGAASLHCSVCVKTKSGRIRLDFGRLRPSLGHVRTRPTSAGIRAQVDQHRPNSAGVDSSSAD